MQTFVSKNTGLLLGILSLIVAFFLFYLNTLSPGLEGGMDSYNHYLIAKNTWAHPELFLDQWGKPLYNLLASPFAQLGISGIVALNILCLLLCAWLAYAIAKKIDIQRPYLAFIFTLLSPIFLDNTVSSLTEPLCALLVLLSVYFLTNQKFALGAAVAGLIPYARSEGFIVLFAVGIYLLFFKKEYRAILFLLAGSLLFNKLGWIIENEPFWVITQNPYINFQLSGKNICGSGSILHYIRAGHYTFGLITSALIATGIGLFALKYLHKKQWIYKPNFTLVVLIFILYFAAHAFIWWQGMMGSCGYVRVMAVIAPLAAIIASYGVNQFLQLIQQWLPHPVHQLLTKTVVVFLLVNSFYVPYRYYAYKYPLTISEEQGQYVKLSDWYKQQDLEERTKIYLYPYFSLLVDIDPYNQDEHLDLWASTLQFTKKGDIIIWDGHFGPNECGIPLESLESNKNWKKIHSIIPAERIVTLNDGTFEIHVFEKIK